MANRDLLMTAATKVGKDARTYCQLNLGKWPGLAIIKLLNQSAAIITMGTKERNSNNFGGNENFFNKTNGITLESKVVTPHKTIVIKIYLEEDMFEHHS